MAKSGYCNHVEDGDTLKLSDETWIRLARVNTPEKNKPGYQKAKDLLKSHVLNKNITYAGVAQSYGRVVAEVSVSGVNINDKMRSAGYK